MEFLARGSKCEWHLRDGDPGISEAVSVKLAQKRELLAGVIRFIWNICHYESHLPEISERSQTSIQKKKTRSANIPDFQIPLPTAPCSTEVSSSKFDSSGGISRLETWSLKFQKSHFWHGQVCYVWKKVLRNRKFTGFHPIWMKKDVKDMELTIKTSLIGWCRIW